MFWSPKLNRVLSSIFILMCTVALLGSCQNKNDKKSQPGGDRVVEDGGDIPQCELPFNLENLEKYQVSEGYYKVGEFVLQAPWALTTCRHESSINGKTSRVVVKGYHQLYYYSPLKLLSKPRLEESPRGIEVHMSVANQAATEDQLRSLARQLGAPETLDLKDGFVLQVYRLTTAFVGDLPVAYANMIANSEYGYDVQISYSNLKKSWLEKELEQVAISGKVQLLGGLSQFGASTQYWNLDFHQVQVGASGRLSLVEKIAYAKEVWLRAETSDFEDDVASALMLVYALTRDLDSAEIKGQFLNLYNYCLDKWTRWPSVAQVESDEDNIYANTLSLLLRMEPNHNAKIVDERMQKLAQVYNYSRGNMLALSLATILEHKMTDAQFALAIKFAPTLNQQNLSPVKKWNMLVDLGNQYEWNEAKLNNIVQLASHCMSLAKINFDESLALVRNYSDRQMTSDDQKVMSNMYYFLQNTYGGPGFEKKRSLAESLHFVFVEQIDLVKSDLMIETFRWLINSYQVNLSKVNAYEKIKEWSRVPTYSRKSFDFMSDVFSQLTNAYRQGYSKQEALEKVELWILKNEMTKDQFSLFQDSFDFLSNTYLVGLTKAEARIRAEKWVIDFKLKAPQLSRIRDIFNQNVRTKGKNEALKLAEKEVLGIN